MKQNAPATARNKDPILAVLGPLLADRRRVLEIAAGTGQHSVHFAQALPHLAWQPTDPSPTARASIDAWRADGPANVLPARELDVGGDWGDLQADAIVCINMIHIAPWEATLALLAGAARLLSAGDPLYLYGPYRFDGAFTAPSNEEFDASLRSRDPRWGVRDLADVTREAERAGFSREAVVAMPANNHSVIFRRT